MPPKAKVVKKEPDVIKLGPAVSSLPRFCHFAQGAQVREGELVFAVAHIFASFNDTFIHVTDLSGRCVHALPLPHHLMAL